MCDNIKVAIKVRPLIRREKELGLTPLWRIKNNSIASIDPNSISEPYCFDHIFDETKSNQSLFEIVAKPIIQNCMKGINGTIFAYGQTSSGKTYTMAGTDTEMGVIPLSIHQIFHEIESVAPERQFLLRIAYIEIYNEKVYDLLDGKLTELKIRDTQNVGEAKVKCHEIIVNSPEKILHYLAEGNVAKRMEETNMNERSSRSHTIFRITIESRTIPKETEGTDERVVQISNLNLVDLAGSEKADQTGTTGARLKEGAFINRSLFSLCFVIKQLSERPDTFINYRDSKLTRILQASLGGNSMTTIICTITPATVEETNYTLFFATRAKTIKNKPIINETLSEATVTRRMQKEISRLKEQLKMEQQKNCKNRNRIEELERDINEQETKFVGSGSYTLRTSDKSRRRTWCPTSSHVNELSVVYEEKETGGCGLFKRSSEHGCLSNFNLLDRESPTPFEYTGEFDSIDDKFRPTENNLSFCTHSDYSLSPKLIMTPLEFKKKRSYNAKCDENCRCDQLERELNDLKEFTRLEKKFDSKSSTDVLPQDYQELKDKLFKKDIQLEILSSRNSELELQIIRLDAKLSISIKMEKDLEKVTENLNEAIKSKDAANQAKVCAEYEYDQLKMRMASREKELISLIEEFRNNDGNAKIMDRIKRMENKIKELENENLLLQTVITDEKSKCESLDKINCQLITDLEQEKSKFQTYLTETKNTIKLLEENNTKFENEIIKLKQLTEENLLLSNELENNRNALLIKDDHCREFEEKLHAEHLRYGKLKQNLDSFVSSDLQEIQSVVLTLQHYLKSLGSEEWNGNGIGKENKNINDYIKDLKTICSSTSCVLAEKQNSNGNLSIEEFSAGDLAIKNSSFILSARDEVAIETLQNRTMDLENQIMKISNQLYKDFATKALQTEWRYEEFTSLNAKYSELQTNYSKLQIEYDEISTGIMDWIQENEVIKKQLTEQEAKHGELNEKYKKLLLENQTFEEHKELISLRANYGEALKFNQTLQENLNDYSALKLKYDNLFDEKRQLEEQLSEKRAENELQHSIETKYEQLLSDKNSLELKFSEMLQNAETMTSSIETSMVNISEENADEKSRKQSLNELSLLQMKYNESVRQNEWVLEKYTDTFENNKNLLKSLEILTEKHESLKHSLIQTEKHRDFLKCKFTLIIQEYWQLFSSVSIYEIKIDNLEKETKTLRETMVDYSEKNSADNLSGCDECELNAKKLVDEIGVLNDKFEAAISERDLVEAKYELFLTDNNGTKNMLDDDKIVALDSFRQDYEDGQVERKKQQKIIDELQEKCDEYIREFEKQKVNYEGQLSKKENEIRQTNNLIHILEDNNSGLKAERDSFKSDVSSANDKYNNLSDKLTESKKLLADSNEIQKSLEQNIASLNGNIAVLQSKCDEFEQVSDTLKTSLEKASGFQKKYSALLIEKQVKDLNVEADYERKFEDKLTEIQEGKAAMETLLRSEMVVMEQKCEKDSIKLQEVEVAFVDLQLTTKQVEKSRNELLAKLTETQQSKASMETLLRSEIIAIEQRFEKDLQTSNQMLEECKCNLQEAEATKLSELETTRQLFELKYSELERNKVTLNEELKSEINTLQNEYQELQKSGEKLKFELKALQTEKTNLQSEHDVLKEQHALILVTSSELKKIVANLEDKNTALKLSKQELETSIKIQAAQIYANNTRLTESETKYNKLNADYEASEKKSKSLQTELDTLKSQLKSGADYSIEIKDLSKQIEILENKNKELLTQLQELQKTHFSNTSQYENEKKALCTKMEESNIQLIQVQKNSNISRNKLLNENFGLKKKNQTLFFELDEIKRKQNDRKSRRSMSYDNNRSSLLDVQTIGTMTDKIDPICNCDVMNEKIKELTRENYLKDCHIRNYQIKEKNNPLIMECSELREQWVSSEKNVVDLQRQLTQLNFKLRKMRDINTNHISTQTPTPMAFQTIGTNTDTIQSSPKQRSHGSSSTSEAKPVKSIQTTDRLIQTEFIGNPESRSEQHTIIRQLEAEVNRLRTRYEESKCLAIARRCKIDLLNDQLAQFKKG